MSDVFLVLAQAPGGLTCFVVPRALDDGTRNPFALQRLKDKLGNHSNASSEVELDGTWGAGSATRAAACAPSSTWSGPPASTASSARRRRCATRSRGPCTTLGTGPPSDALLVDQPLMRNVLADLALEAEAATVLGLRLAHAFDTGETELARLGVALGKFWVCKRTAPMVAEALECLGGNGYVEENGLARLYREAPLNSIWEGSGNVNALDVMRAVTREPASLEALTKELHRVRGRERGARRPHGLRSRASALARPDVAGGGVRRPLRSSSGWPSPCRRACSSSTPPPPSPTRSSPAGSRVAAATPSARSTSTWPEPAGALIDRAG